jgi:hypothetical protein
MGGGRPRTRSYLQQHKPNISHTELNHRAHLQFPLKSTHTTKNRTETHITLLDSITQDKSVGQNITHEELWKSLKMYSSLSVLFTDALNH